MLAMLITIILTFVGCVHNEYNGYNKTHIRGQEIYMGMPVQKLDSLLGAPDKSENGPLEQFIYYYDEYTIVTRLNVVNGIWKPCKSDCKNDTIWGGITGNHY